MQHSENHLADAYLRLSNKAQEVLAGGTYTSCGQVPQHFAAAYTNFLVSPTNGPSTERGIYMWAKQSTSREFNVVRYVQVLNLRLPGLMRREQVRKSALTVAYYNVGVSPVARVFMYLARWHLLYTPHPQRVQSHRCLKMDPA